jgi:glycosyltransferase involved in cell wall biosynthesis
LGKHKICVYAICKNEEQFVDRWMDSVSEADLVVVVDTGSTDNTIEKLRQRGAQVYSFENKPFRFDYSRNYALNFVPDDVDICVSPDLDEVFNPGWRKNLDEQWRDDTTRGNYLYNWSFAEDGTPMVQYVHERIHARHNYHWIYPTHELLEYTGPGEEKRQFFEGVVFNHHPDPKKDRSLNLPLLELAYQERPNDGRTLHYLGREYLYAQMWQKCIDILKRYLEPGISDWDEERSASMRFISRSYGGLGNVYEQKKWLYKAMAETPYLREPYVELEQLAYKESDWPAVYFFANEALKIRNKTLRYVNEVFAWDQTPDDLCAIACYQLGLYRQSAAHARAALELKPEDERLKNNLKLIEEKLKAEA